VPGHVVQDEGATHNVAGTAEHLGQAGADDVAVGKQGEVGKGSDGVINYEEEVVSF